MSGFVRKSLLVAALMLVASVYCYEKFVIQRRVVRLQEELRQLVDDMAHTYSEETVASLINEPYEVIYDSKQRRILKFSWRGLTWKSYDLYVVFRKFRGSTLITEASLVEPSPTKPLIDRDEHVESAATDPEANPLFVNQPASSENESINGRNGG
jgi:hypothetical protein